MIIYPLIGDIATSLLMWGTQCFFFWHVQTVAGDCAAGTFPQHNLLQLLTVQDSSGALLNIGADRSYILS